MRAAVLLPLLLLAACARPTSLAADHPANPAAPAGMVIPPVGLADYLPPEALTARAEAAARTPAPAPRHEGH